MMKEIRERRMRNKESQWERRKMKKEKVKVRK